MPHQDYQHTQECIADQLRLAGERGGQELLCHKGRGTQPQEELADGGQPLYCSEALLSLPRWHLSDIKLYCGTVPQVHHQCCMSKALALIVLQLDALVKAES